MLTENLLTTKTVKTIDPKDIDFNRLYVLVMFDKDSLDDIVIIGRFIYVTTDKIKFEILSIKPLSGYGIWKRDPESDIWRFYESSTVRKDDCYYKNYIELEDYMDSIRQFSILYTDIVNNHSNGVSVKLETRTLDDINQTLSTISAKSPYTEDDSNNDNNLPWYKKLWKKLTNKKVTTDISDKGNSVYVASGSDNVVIGNITQISNNTEIRKEE